jgi:hypothetical protein
MAPLFTSAEEAEDAEEVGGKRGGHEQNDEGGGHAGRRGRPFLHLMRYFRRTTHPFFSNSMIISASVIGAADARTMPWTSDMETWVVRDLAAARGRMLMVVTRGEGVFIGGPWGDTVRGARKKNSNII